LPVQPDLKSRSPVLNVRQGEETRGLDATAPAFVPSATPLPAAPPAAVAASVDGSAVVVKR
jgi:small neutral amino acid transporter SnatA (MarC family)